MFLPGHPSHQPMPEGYREVCELINAMRAGLVRPFSWEEWQQLPAVFCQRLGVAIPVIADVVSYRAGQGG